MSISTSKRSSSPQRMWGFRILAISLGLLFALLTSEIILRILDAGKTVQMSTHPYRGRAYPPNSAFDFSGEGLQQRIELNAWGFRDTNWTTEKPENTFRIAVLGDSYVEAPQVALEDRFTEQLESELNHRGIPQKKRVEVMNFGISTYGTMQELQTLGHDVWQFAPDLILLCLLTGNDFQNNCKELAYEPDRPYLEMQNDSFVEMFPGQDASTDSLASRLLAIPKSSRIWGLKLKYDYHRFMMRKRKKESELYKFPNGPLSMGIEAGLDLAIYKAPQTPAWEHAWLITEELLRRFNDECKGHNTRWILVTLSNGIQIHPDTKFREAFREAMQIESFNYPDDRLREAARRDGYNIVCLAPLLLNVAQETQSLLHGFENMQLGFGHWNKTGHREAAKIIASTIFPTGDRTEDFNGNIPEFSRDATGENQAPPGTNSVSEGGRASEDRLERP